MVLQFDTPRAETPLQSFAVHKRLSGTDLDCKCIGLDRGTHYHIYERMLQFIYSDTAPLDLSCDFTSRFTTDALNAIDKTPISFCGADFNQLNSRTENLFVSRSVETGSDVRAYIIPRLDSRIKLSISHIRTEDNEFIVMRFKYPRYHLSGTGVRISAKVCFLDISICRKYDDSYTCNRIPKCMLKLHKTMTR